MATLISEFEPNPNGADPSNVTFELSGTPGDSFSGAIVSIESDSSSSNIGTVDRAASVSGTFDVNGLLTVSIPDLENPSFTVALLEAFTGAAGTTDIDTDNDGVADDLSTFGTVLDAIGVPDESGDEATLYGTDLGGTDFTFTGDEPRLIFRDGSVGDLYAINDPDGGEVFDVSGSDVTPGIFNSDPTVGTDTFGSINPSVSGGGTSLAIAPTAQNEGNSGTTAFTFTVTRSGDTSGTTTVEFATLDGTAIDGVDYTGTSGTVTFDPDDTSETITVNVIGETDLEADENFTVTLFNPSGGASITTASADGTIQNDDVAAPQIDVTLTDVLQLDNDSDAAPSPGDGLRYTAVVSNTGTASESGVTFTMPAISDTALTVGSVTTSQGTVTSGNTGGDTTVAVNVGTLAASGSTTITFDVLVDSPFTGSSPISGQGTVSGDTIATISTDDPDTGTVDDATLTPINLPEIDVQGNNLSIADGDITPATADHTDFGSQDIASGTVSRTFTIENTGSATLTLPGNPVSITGANASDFTVTQPSEIVLTLSPSGSSFFSIEFDPSAAGLRTAEVSIVNDDSDENPFNFTIQGMGTATPGVTITETSGTSVEEGGATDTYMVVLDAQPTGNVIVNITPDSQTTVDLASLTFTSSNWDTAQTVTVTADDDSAVEGDHSSTITHAIGPSSAAEYLGVSINNVTVNITDNDFNDITGGSGSQTLTGTDGPDRITGGRGRDVITGGAGNDEFVYTQLRDGGDTITDFTAGEDQIDLSAVMAQIGYGGSDPITDNYLSFRSFGSHTIIRLDVDGTATRGRPRGFLLVQNVTSGDLNNINNFII